MPEIATSVGLLLLGQLLQYLRSHFADKAERAQRDEQTALLRAIAENSKPKTIG